MAVADPPPSEERMRIGWEIVVSPPDSLVQATSSLLLEVAVLPPPLELVCVVLPPAAAPVS